MKVVRELRDLLAANRADEHTFWTRIEIIDVKMPLVHEETVGLSNFILDFAGIGEIKDEFNSTGRSLFVLRSPTSTSELFAWRETIPR